MSKHPVTTPIESEILRRLESTDLPVMPQIFRRVVELTDQEDTSAQDLARTILEDQVLTGKILSIANTPFYGIGQKVATITKAVIVLGFTTVRKVVLMVSVSETLMARFSGEAFRSIWLHSLGCGVAARSLSGKVGMDPETMLVLGLLHDCGRLFLRHFYPDEYRRVERAIAGGDPELRAEREILGCTHEDVGAHIVRAWRLPDMFEAVVGGHHTPNHGDPRYLRERQLVRIANMLSWHAFGQPGAPSRQADLAVVLEHAKSEFGIDEKTVRDVLRDLAGQVRSIVDSLDLGIRVPETAEFEPDEPDEKAPGTAIAEMAAHAGKMARQLTLIHEISSMAVSGDYDLDEVFQAIVEGIHRGVGFDRTFLLTRDKTRRSLVGRIGLGGDAPRLAKRMRVSLGDETPGLLQEVLESSQSFNVANARVAPYNRLPRLELADLLGCDAFAAVPLSVGREVIGCVLVDNAASRDPIGDREIDSITTFVNLANLTLSRGRAPGRDRDRAVDPTSESDVTPT